MMPSWIGAPYVWLRALLLVAIVIEFASFLRVRRWNWWLTLLSGTTLLQMLLLSSVMGIAKSLTLAEAAAGESPVECLVLWLSNIASAATVGSP